MGLPVNVDSRETEKFSALTASWWDPRGPMHALHSVNPLRTVFIADGCDVRARKALDVGCGGGLLAEALARMGARVTGIDLSQDLLALATLHAREAKLPIEYCYISAEQLAARKPGIFQIITCMEVLEHVPRPKELFQACARLLEPGGHAFFATIDRSLKALLYVVFGAEYVLHLLPVGTHHFGGFIRPDELKSWGRDCGLEYAGSASTAYNPFTRKFSLARPVELAYIIHFIKR